MSGETTITLGCAGERLIWIRLINQTVAKSSLKNIFCRETLLLVYFCINCTNVCLPMLRYRLLTLVE